MGGWGARRVKPEGVTKRLKGDLPEVKPEVKPEAKPEVKPEGARGGLAGSSGRRREGKGGRVEGDLSSGSMIGSWQRILWTQRTLFDLRRNGLILGLHGFGLYITHVAPGKSHKFWHGH